MSDSFAAPGGDAARAAKDSQGSQRVQLAEPAGVEVDSGSAPLAPASVLRLQRVAGNHAVQRMLAERQTPPSAAPARPRITDTVADAQSTAVIIQREDEDGPGLLSGPLAWIRGAWDRVRRSASEGLDGLRNIVRAGVDGLRSAFDVAKGIVERGWAALQSGARSLIAAATQNGSALLGGLLGHFSEIGAAVIALDADRLRSAWAGLTGGAQQAWTTVKGLATGAIGQVQGLWAQVQGASSQLLGGLAARAEGLLESLPGAAQTIRARIGGLWHDIADRAGAVLRHLPGWGFVERLWNGLSSRVVTAAGDIVGGARNLWQGLQTRATSAWHGIQTGWDTVRNWVSEQASSLIGGFERIAGALKASVITPVVDTVGRLGGLFKAIQEAIRNPDLVIDPLAQGITQKLTGLPQATETDVRTRIPQAASGAGGGTSGGGSGGRTGGGVPIQRTVDPAAAARGTVGLGTLIVGVWAAISQKVGRLLGNLGGEIKKMLLGLVWPPATWEGLKEDWAEMTKQLATRVARFHSIRLDSFGHFFEDLSRFVSNLLDFPLIIWRTANAMLGRLSIYITVLLVVVGAIGGAVGGTVGGAILGAMAGGAPAVPGAAAGGGVGLLAGAGIGLAAAGKLGLGLLLSFVAAEVATIEKTVVDLLLVPQTSDERQEDYNQVADSVIGVVVAGLLTLLAWIAARIARGILTLVQRFRTTVVEPPPSEFPDDTSCFVPGTLVLTETGPRGIETLSVGDYVLAASPDTGRQAFQSVTACTSHASRRLLDLQVGGSTITCTPMHPFWVPGEGWVKAGALRVATPLQMHSGAVLHIESIAERSGHFTVLNLTVAGLHTYFVGTHAVLVHNKGAETVPGKLRLSADIAGSQRFAARVRQLIGTAQRPGAKPSLESRMQAIDETLSRLKTEVDAAERPQDLEGPRRAREQAQRELDDLNRDAQRAQSHFPDSWSDFDERLHAEFEQELNRFRGNTDLEPTPNLRGGEGQLFLSRLRPAQALKRWFSARLSDMAESLRLLRAARATVQGNAALSPHMDVVEVGSTGSDWAVRGFEADSITLADAVGSNPAAATARAQAIAALQGSTDAVSQSLLSKLNSNSANLHWSPSRGKIIVIDMQ